MNLWRVAEIRSVYTDSTNRCRDSHPAPIAIAHDIAVLCGEIVELRALLGLKDHDDVTASQAVIDEPV